MQRIVLWLGIAVAGLVFAGLSHNLIHQPDGGAAWVQAIGSIAAIFCAIWIGERSAKHQTELAQNLREQQLAERRSSLKAVLDEVYVRFKRIEPSLNENGVFSFSAFAQVSEEHLERTLDLLGQVPIFDLDSGELTQAVLTIQAACMSLTRLVTQFKLHQKENPNDYPGDDIATAFMRGSLQTLDETFATVVKLTNGTFPKLRPPSLY
ncbi:hypothetical protein WJ99_13880 [Burkholderia ubonensis]|nr:hypothetical protein [Burkholderia ubonensis]KVG77196.1 hypothetical protein WJ34_02180 [Burkholderia ubonensis]KVH15818.1 hypothetical protein WJ37_31300 [Burkholderia ubonensis]KVH53092.1 hypothetical protein WJ38_02815 [Burkholderia ubonensis]KVH82355.1 hypothetical protein WJ43_26275 [Burkholderia ubonensis]KVM29003.1 hypothetical protein WJ55_23820 [Burkholderia ubonensis]